MQIRRVPNVDKPTADALAKFSYHKVDDLWRAIGRDFDVGLAKVAAATGVPQQRLKSLLVDAARPQYPSRPVAREWALAGALFLLLLALVWRTAAAAGLVMPTASVATPLAAFLASGASHVVAAEALPAFHIIQPGDLREEAGVGPAGALAVEAGAIGHFILEPVAKGNSIQNAQLSALQLAPGDLAGRQVMTLLLGPGAAGPHIRTGDRIGLLLAPRAAGNQPSPEPLQVDAIVLRLESSGTGTLLTAAIDSGQVPAIGRLLGNADTFILQAAPSGTPVTTP